MIIFLYGGDSYRIGQKLKEIIERYKVKNPTGFNLVNLDLSESKTEDFFEAVKSDSLIPEKKLIIVKNIETADSEELLGFIKSQNLSKREDVILIIVSFKDSGKNKLSEYLTGRPNRFQNFKLLKEYEVKNWARKLLDSLEVDLTGEALDLLVSSCDYNLWRIDSEIRKIADYKIKGVISKSQIEELFIPGKEHNIFELTDALLGKNKKKAIIALYEAIESGEKPTELLGLLAWQVRNLLRFKTGAQPDQLKLHPFVLGKLKESAKIFSIEEISAFLSKIIDLDLAFKTTDLNKKTALSLLISEM